mmetsp:Transcript_47575/g.110925  ORF Transcript_47575/g.110925 Transcript_47575/m.110925 type:complete len:815 (+) Transcript_47575:95-2539(+)
MHAIPEKLAALRQSIEGTMTQRMTEQRVKLEQHIADSCKDSESAAVRRAEASLKPQISGLDERWQVKIQEVQLRVEEAFPKITEVADLLTATRLEIQPLHARADAAAARLDRLAVQTATTTKDVADLGDDMRDAVTKLRENLEEERQQRLALGEELKALLQEHSEKAAAATKVAAEKAEDQASILADGSRALEERLMNHMGEQAERSRREQKLGDEDALKQLRSEIQALSEVLEVRVASCNAEAEALSKKCAETLRDEMDASSKRVISLGEQTVEKKARDVMAKMAEGFEAANLATEQARVQAKDALLDATAGFARKITEACSRFAAEDEMLNRKMIDVDNKAMEASKEAERKASEVAARRLEDATSELKDVMHKMLKQLTDADNDVRTELEAQLQKASSKLERNVADMGNSCNAFTTASVGQATTDLQAALAESSTQASQSTAAAKSEAAVALQKEAASRRQELEAVEQAKNALAKDLRDHIVDTAAKASADTKSHTTEVGHRFDQMQDQVKSLQRSLEAVTKEQGDCHAKILEYLKTERQKTEEVDADHARKIAEARDNHEAQLRTEVVALQTQLAECRKKVLEEGAALRGEMREQPSKKEVLDVSSQSMERYHDLATALDQYKARLEAAVADFSSRCREVRGEASEARLRMQRENMVLGTEITQLKMASTSLANGVVKALQVLGFLQSEAKPATPADSTEGDKAALEAVKSLEVEDLLEWEKVGKSLASQIARQWYQMEAVGIHSLLALVEQKADSDDLVRLRLMLSEHTKLTETAASWTSTCASRQDKVSPPLGSAPAISSPLKGRRSIS